MTEEHIGPCGRYCEVVDECDARGKRIAELEAAQEKLGLSLCKIGNKGYYVCEAVAARIAELEAALKPFEEELRNQELEVPQVVNGENLIHNYGLRLRDLRAARAALNGEKG